MDPNAPAAVSALAGAGGLSGANASIPPELRPRQAPSVGRGSTRPERLDPSAVRIHIIQPGESLWSISRMYDVNLTTLMETNQISRGKLLSPGQPLLVARQPGLFRKVLRGETLEGICRDYEVSLAAVLHYNQIADARKVGGGTMLFLPGAKARRGSNFFTWPVQGYVSSTYGTRRNPWGGDEEMKFHYGIDVAAPSGRPIVAAQDGRVQLAGRNGSLGLCVVLVHQDGYATVYGHASRLLVKEGMEVKQGETIALVGRTGHTTGSHLHFEIRRNDRPMDPLPVLPKVRR